MTNSEYGAGKNFGCRRALKVATLIVVGLLALVLDQTLIHHVYIGTDDILLPDARRLRERVAAAGGQIQVYEYLGAFHVFVGATFTPEAHDAFRKVAESMKALAARSG